MAGKTLTPAEIRLSLRDSTHARKIERAASFYEEMKHVFSQESADALLEALGAGASDEERKATIDWAETLDLSSLSRYLQAKLFTAAGGSERAAERWAQFLASHHCDDPLIFLQHARVLASLGRYAEAASQLRQALAYRPSYPFYPRAAKLIAEVWRHHPPTLRKVRIAVLGSSTTSMLIPVMRALCFRDGIDAEFYEGVYGAFRQEILDPESALTRFQPNVVFIVVNWRDLDLPAVSDDEDASVERVVEDYKSLWRTLSARSGCHVVQHSFDTPAQEAYGYLAESLAGGRTRVTRLINLRLAREATEGVSVLDTAGVVGEVGLDRWEDPALWNVAKQHPSAEALPQLAEAQLAHVRAVTGLTRKVLVCDLDNTLWGGVIGEDGLQGIKIGAGSPIGEAYARLQRYLLDLKSRGILLAVCSKNNPEDARLPFEQHEQMLLRAEDFVLFNANWNDKAQNLRDIAERLSLGTDSFVFIDDNPVERAWIRSQMPEVAVVELGATPFTYTRDLDRGRYFYSLSFSAEDRERSKLYRSEAARDAARGSAESLEEFLGGLQMQAKVSPVDEQNIARVTQLTNKTNQFNLTTKRYTQGQVEQLAARAEAWTGVFQLADRFGDHGIIGVMFAVPAGEPKTWEIDTWLMSCRVLGRQMEIFMFNQLVEAAQKAGIERLVGVYRPTAKNVQVADLYQRLGFEERRDSPDAKEFELSISPSDHPRVTFIHKV